MRQHHRLVDASVEASGRHNFAVRSRHVRLVRNDSVHRIPYPTFVTMRNAPCVQEIWQNVRTGGCHKTARCWN